KTTLCEADVIRNGAVAGLRRIGGCEAYPSARKARIEPKRFLVKLHGSFDVAGCTAIVEKATLQIYRERLRIHRRSNIALGHIGQRDVQCLRDSGRDLRLNCEGVFKLSVVRLRPRRRTGRRIDELRRDADSIGRLPYSALENISDVELFGDSPEIGIGSLERERRCSGYHSKRTDVG